MILKIIVILSAILVFITLNVVIITAFVIFPPVGLLLFVVFYALLLVNVTNQRDYI